MRKIIGILLFALAACGGDKVTGPDEVAFAGTYSLQTINGSRLPVVALQSGTTSISVVADQLTIADGGTWTESLTTQTTQNGQTTTQVGANQGVWLRSLNSITLSSTKNGNTAYSGSFSSNRLDLSSGSLAFVFTR